MPRWSSSALAAALAAGFVLAMLAVSSSTTEHNGGPDAVACLGRRLRLQKGGCNCVRGKGFCLTIPASCYVGGASTIRYSDAMAATVSLVLQAEPRGAHAQFPSANSA